MKQPGGTTRGFNSAMFVGVLLLLATFVPAQLRAEDSKTKSPVIEKVTFTFESGNPNPVQMDIVGHGFRYRNVAVKMAGIPQTVKSATDTHVTVTPTPLSPGSYLLRLIYDSNNEVRRSVKFEVTLGDASGTGGAQGPQGPPGPQGLPGLAGPAGRRVKLARLALLDPPEQPGPPDPSVLLVLPAQPDPPVLLEQPALPEQLVLPDPSVLLVLPVLPDPPVLLVLPEQPDPPDPSVLLVLLDTAGAPDRRTAGAHRSRGLLERPGRLVRRTCWSMDQGAPG